MISFRLAHLSDLHFGRRINWFSPLDHDTLTKSTAGAFAFLTAKETRGRAADIFYPSTFSPDAAVSLLSALDDQKHDIDGIVITGDLATTGDDRDLKIACEYFSGSIPESWGLGKPNLLSLVASLRYSLLTLPGNHDRYDGPALTPTSRNYENFFGAAWDFNKDRAYASDPTDKSSRRVQISMLRQEEKLLGILLADLSLKGINSGSGLLSHLGQGDVIQHVIDELSASTKGLQADALAEGFDMGIIWAVHFPPNFPDVNNSLALLNSGLLVDAATATGVSLILAGHTHKTLRYKATSSTGTAVEIICTGPSAGISDHDTYSFSIIDLDVSQGVVIASPTHFKFDEDVFKEQSDFPTV